MDYICCFHKFSQYRLTLFKETTKWKRSNSSKSFESLYGKLYASGQFF